MSQRLQTVINDVLQEQMQYVCDEMGITINQLVRRVLEDAFFFDGNVQIALILHKNQEEQHNG